MSALNVFYKCIGVLLYTLSGVWYSYILLKILHFIFSERKSVCPCFVSKKENTKNELKVESNEIFELECPVAIVVE